MYNSKTLINLSIYLIISLVIGVFSFNYIKQEEQILLSQKYSTIAQHMKTNIASLIEDKKNATLAFAISASKEEKIQTALLQNNPKIVDFRAYSQELREKTKFKNVWFQILTNEGKSFYRSWTNKKSDSLTFRPDVQKMLLLKKIQASISVGRYDMTFKTMIPIFSNKKFIGIFEIITHFNSISRIMEKGQIDSIMLADKRYKTKLAHPFTKKFIGEYYIANLNAKPEFIKLIKEYSVEKLLAVDDYIILNNKLLTTYEIIEIDNKPIGYVILSKDLKNINTKQIMAFKKTALSFLIFTIILLGFIFAIITYYFYSNRIKILYDSVMVQKEKNQQVLDSQRNIIIITDGVQLQEANQRLFEFFPEYENLKAFKKDHDCVCDYFIDMDSDHYVIDIDYDGNNWAEHILANPQNSYKAAMYHGETLHHFSLHVKLSQFTNEDKPYIIVTLTDVTEEIKRQQELKNLNENLELLVDFKTKELQQLNETLEERVKKEINKNKEKDRILFQQNKMAAMGEMLHNIAHQWRQPLSTISTSASSIQLQNELKILDDNTLEDSCKHILSNTQYLSQTIDDFKNFFKQDKEKTEFLIYDAIIDDIKLIKDNLKAKQIHLVTHDIDTKASILGYKNEFQQAILNILQNAIDALVKNRTDNRTIFIEYKDNVLSIKDNAGGIDEKIIEKIFEPYFTTKHQSQGTGIGLYMTQEILQKHMNAEVKVKNITFEYKGESYEGSNFIITFKK